jgi:capsular polysaccharide biosynthesis protein
MLVTFWSGSLAQWSTMPCTKLVGNFHHWIVLLLNRISLIHDSVTSIFILLETYQAYRRIPIENPLAGSDGRENDIMQNTFSLKPPRELAVSPTILVWDYHQIVCTRNQTLANKLTQLSNIIFIQTLVMSFLVKSGVADLSLYTHCAYRVS